MKHLVAMAEQKGCHGNYNGNGATATFRVIRQLIEMSVQEKMWMSGSCEDGGGDPGYRVTHGSTAWQPRRNVQ